MDIILDTDLGADCDDAVALALLLKAEKAGKCRLKAITASTAREGATATAEAICGYYGFHKPTAHLTQPLDCDKTDCYARAVMEKFGTSDTDEEAVNLLRKTLAESEGRLTFIAIGPLTNVAALLKSPPDGYSPLSGAELFKQKVDKIYVMGGNFRENNAAMGYDKDYRIPEWNIFQDVEAAKYVFDNLTTEAVLIPHEAGINVYTEMGEDGDNPVWYSMAQFALNAGITFDDGKFRRHSWDPITCLMAVDDLSRWFGLSPLGKITVDGEGFTHFTEGKGNSRFLTVKGDFVALGQYIDALMK